MDWLWCYWNNDNSNMFFYLDLDGRRSTCCHHVQSSYSLKGVPTTTFSAERSALRRLLILSWDSNVFTYRKYLSTWTCWQFRVGRGTGCKVLPGQSVPSHLSRRHFHEKIKGWMNHLLQHLETGSLHSRPFSDISQEIAPLKDVVPLSLPATILSGASFTAQRHVRPSRPCFASNKFTQSWWLGTWEFWLKNSNGYNA